MSVLLRLIAPLLLVAMTASIGDAQDAPALVEKYVFLRDAGINKYHELAFTAEQQLLPTEIQATEKGRLKIQGVWVDRSDVMNVEEAIKHFTNQLESEPSDTTSLLRRGIAFQTAERYSSAIEDYNALIALGGKNARAFEFRGAARFARAAKSRSTSPLADLDAALSDFTEAIRLAPTDNHALIERGNVRRYLKEFDVAVRDYTDSIRIKPSEPLAYAFRAKALEAKGESEEALRDYTRAIAIDDSSTMFLVSRGNLLVNMKKYDVAIKDYDKAIALNGACTTAFFHRAAAYQLSDNFEAAIADYTTVISQDPPAVDALRNRAIVFTACGQLENALADFNAAIAIDATNAEVFYLRGKIHGQQMRYASAIEDFTESLRLDDTLVQNYRTRGLVHKKLGNYENAVRDFSEFVRRRPTNQWILNELAWIQATCADDKVRDGPKAVELAKRACAESNWKDSSFIDTLAAAYAETGDWKNAVGNQEQAIRLAATEAERADRRNRLKLYQNREAVRMP